MERLHWFWGRLDLMYGFHSNIDFSNGGENVFLMIASSFLISYMYIKLAGNRDIHKNSHKFELWQDRTVHLRVT